MSSTTCPRLPVTRIVSWCWFPNVPLRQRRSTDRADGAPIEAQDERVVEFDAGTRTVGEGRDLGRPQVGQRVHHEAEAVGELALPVAAARDGRVRPGHAARRRDVGVAQIRRAGGQQVADHRRHLDRDVLHFADPVRALDEPASREADAHLVPCIAQHDVAATLARQAIDRPGVGGIDGEGLLGQDVDARLERSPRLLGPEGNGPGQRDDIRACLDDLVPVDRRSLEVEALAQRFKLHRIAPVDDERFDLRAAQEGAGCGRRPPRRRLR